jgi:hypothetical protein
MLSLPKQLTRIVGVVTLAARASCFGKLSMTFFYPVHFTFASF